MKQRVTQTIRAGIPFLILALGAVVTIRLSGAGYETRVVPESGPSETSSSVRASGPTETVAEGPFYLIGAVRRPGIYTVSPGTYLYELIERAGGLTETADRASVNLAATIDPGGMLEIPEVSAPPTTDSPGATPGPTPPPTTVTANYGLHPATTPAATQGPTLRVNEADADAWTALPGIGPVTAEAIVATRERLGGFKRPEDLMEVPGIKERRLEQLRPYLIFPDE